MAHAILVNLSPPVCIFQRNSQFYIRFFPFTRYDSSATSKTSANLRTAGQGFDRYTATFFRGIYILHLDLDFSLAFDLIIVYHYRISYML